MTQPEKVSEILRPDKADIKDHILFILSGMKKYEDGVFEISYGDLTLDNAPNRAKRFCFDEVDEAVEFAAQRNSEGRNVYIVGSILLPGETKGQNERSGDEDFYASGVVWLDIDNDPDDETKVVTPQILSKMYEILPPSRVVVTGRKPFLRAHLWWKLDKPEDDDSLLETALKGVCSFFGGDTSVTNESRLMRLAGTVSYATEKKKAKAAAKGRQRIDEMVKFGSLKNATESVNIDKLIRAYPYKNPVPHKDRRAKCLNLINSNTRSDEDIRKLLHDIGNPDAVTFPDAPNDTYLPWVKVGMALYHAGYKFELWDEWSSTGEKYKLNTKNEMLRKWNGFGGKSGPVSTLGTIAKLASLSRDKNKPNSLITTPAHNSTTGEIIPKISATDISLIDLDHIPPREFLYHNILARKYVTMIVAPPGVGKSILTLQMSVSMASGRAWGAWTTPKNIPLRVWVYNNEEGLDELRRRIKGVMMSEGVVKTEISGNLYIDSGENRAIEVATLDSDDSVIWTPDYKTLKQEVIDRKIDVLIIDPFAETYSVRENDNDHIKKVTALYRRIAVDCNCSVLLVHHTRKGIEGNAGNADTARGGGAQIGVVRRAFTITHMEEDEANKLGVPTEYRKWFIRMDDAKTNITAPADKISWLRLKSININNGSGLFPDGDSVGVLTHTNPEEICTEFTSKNESEYEVILQEICEWMSFHGLSETSLPNAVKAAVRSKKLPYRDRKMHDMVSVAMEELPKSKGFMANGTVNFLSISEKKGHKNSLIIVRKTEKNFDY